MEEGAYRNLSYRKSFKERFLGVNAYRGMKIVYDHLMFAATLKSIDGDRAGGENGRL